MNTGLSRVIDTRNVECNMLRQIRWPNPTTVPLQRPWNGGADSAVRQLRFTDHALTVHVPLRKFGNRSPRHPDDRPAHLTKECDVIVMSNYVWSPDVGVRPTSGWNRRVE